MSIIPPLRCKKRKKRLHVYLFSIYFMYTGLGHLLAPKDSKPYSLPLEWRGAKQGEQLNKALQILLCPLPSPPQACPAPCTGHLAWTYQSCLCPRLGHSSKRKRRRSLSGPHLVDEVFLAPPSALLHSRLSKPTSPVGAKVHRGKVGKWEAGCWGRNTRRTKAYWGSGQRWANFCSFIPLENWYLLLHGGSFPNLRSPKKPRPPWAVPPSTVFPP